MRERLRDFAPYLSILGLILLAGALLMRSGPTSAPTWLVPTLAVVGVVLVLGWPILRWDDFREGLGGRQASHGANSLVLALSVIGILVVANYVGSLWYWSWDMTENNKFTISRATVQILNDLDRPVKLVGVLDAAQSGEDITTLERLVEQYKRHSKQIEYEHLDPQGDPLGLQALAGQLTLASGSDVSVQSLGRTLVAISGEKHAIVYAFDEQGVTEAIVKATRDRELSVWFTTGHDERPLNTDYGQMRGALEKQGYEVSEHNLGVLTETLTADTVDAVIVAGPRKAFPDVEAQALADYVKGGGSVLLMADPQLAGLDINLGALLAPWDLTLRNDVVLDPARSFSGNMSHIVVPAAELRFHTSTRDLTSIASVVTFPLVRSIATGTPATTTLTTTSLAETSADAWGETGLDELAAAAENYVPTADPQEPKGPLTLALAAEGGVDYGRLLIYGSSQFVTDAYIQAVTSLNPALFLNTLNWLTQEDDLITIAPTTPGSHPLKTPTNPTLLAVATAVLMPLAVLGVGGWIWWRRR